MTDAAITKNATTPGRGTDSPALAAEVQAQNKMPANLRLVVEGDTTRPSSQMPATVKLASKLYVPDVKPVTPTEGTSHPGFSIQGIVNGVQVHLAQVSEDRSPIRHHAASAGEFFSPLTTLTSTYDMAKNTSQEVSQGRFGLGTSMSVATVGLMTLSPVAGRLGRSILGKGGVVTEELAAGGTAAERAAAERNVAETSAERAAAETGYVSMATRTEQSVTRHALDLLAAKPTAAQAKIEAAITGGATGIDTTGQAELLAASRHLEFRGATADVPVVGARPISGEVPSAPNVMTAQKDGVFTITRNIDDANSSVRVSINDRHVPRGTELDLAFARLNGDGTRTYITRSGDGQLIIDPQSDISRLILPGRSGETKIPGVPDFILSGDGQVDLYFKSAPVDQDLTSSLVHITAGDKFGSGSVLIKDGGMTFFRTSYHGPAQFVHNTQGIGGSMDLFAFDERLRHTSFDAQLMHVDPTNDVALLSSTTAPSFLTTFDEPALLSPGSPVRFRGHGYNFLDPLGSSGKVQNLYRPVPSPHSPGQWRIGDIDLAAGTRFNPDQDYQLINGFSVVGVSGSRAGDGVALMAGRNAQNQDRVIILPGQNIPLF